MLAILVGGLMNYQKNIGKYVRGGTMINLTGQQFGNYHLVRRLGTGGFASVYLGRHVHIPSMQAAIKILHLFDVNVRQFQQEAETTERLRHPNIVRLLDFDVQESTPFLVLDYAPGGSLSRRHPQGSQLSLTTVTQYLKELAPALQYAHDHNVLHRDIKPDNILIGLQGELLLSDFGIALLLRTGKTSLQDPSSIAGTPEYMAPEQFRGKPERASDQYALAIVIYEWLSGAVPFREGNWIGLGYQHNHEPVPSLCTAIPSLPKSVEVVVMRALSKQSQDRFPSVQAFVEALEAASQKPIIPASVLPKQMPVPVSSARTKEQWLEEGKKYSDAKRHTEALTAYEQAIRLDPNYDIAYYKKGWTLSELKRYQESLDVWEQVIRLNPNDAVAYSNKGHALSKLKRYNESLEAHEQSLRLDPKYVNAYISKAAVLDYLKRYDEALSACEQALRLDPNRSGPYINQGNAFWHLNRCQEALTAYEQAIRLSPNSGMAYFNKGLALEKLGRQREAKSAYKKARELGYNG